MASSPTASTAPDQQQPPPPVPAKSLASAHPAPTSAPPSHPPPLRLAIVGDVHGAWGPEDDAALASLAPHAALFVGDFGEEDVGLVKRLAAAGGGAPPRFFVLGNHDAWFCLTKRGQDRAVRKGVAGGGDGLVSPGVRAQLAALGRTHVGWGHALVRGAPQPLAIAGGRPFSKGGAQWSDVAAFYAAFAPGVATLRDAATKTASALASAGAALQAAAADAAPTDAAPPRPGALVLLAHNGPAGLGGRAADPCGADFLAGGGDWGDPDLAAALDAACAAAAPAPAGPAPVAAVLFGHMHRNLRGDPRPRDAVRFDEGRRRGGGGRGGGGAGGEAASRTVFLNAAVVPRRRSLPGAPGGSAPPTTACHFLVLELDGGLATAAADVWVGVAAVVGGEGGGGGSGFACAPLLERPLLVTGAGGDRWAWQAHEGVWVKEGG